ncbi:MAG TPA: Gfo/Idh/MocA family oxidoreductase [Pirellulaceae bacterium]|nr:Gfo/Idh/MocA family oxidoreductase [Pirellulaceae bacterium]
MTTKLCRFGILGAATIARKNWQAILNSGNATLTAVASRSRERAEQFIQECQASAPFAAPPRICGYDELLASRDVDAVYIPLPTGVRKEWVLKAAAAGKHVLCEKPCGATAAEVAEMIAACERANVQFMDGVMFMHSSRLPAMRKALDDGQSVGRIRWIASQFSFLGGEEFARKNIRVNSTLEPLGCLGDLGWYNLRFTLWAMGYQTPQRASGRVLTAARQAGASDVPVEFSGELHFAGGASATFYCSFITQNQQWAVVSGERGALHVEDFVLPFFGSEAAFSISQPQFDVRGCQFNMNERTRRIALPEYSNNAPNSQETNLFRNFAALALGGKPDPHWPRIALQTQQVLEACLKSSRQDGQPVSL